MVVPDDLERMWADLLPIGRTAGGGYRRQPWTGAETEMREWFGEQARARGLRLVGDGVGNTVAWWDAGAGPGVLSGSHLDSVVDGGAYDGPLGVVSALAALDRLRAEGFEPVRPLGVGFFVEEEGSRFGRACLGSRLATGSLAWSEARGLRDDDGVRLGDLVPGLEADRSRVLGGVAAFVELHVEQGRGLVHLDAPVGLASGIWPHGRWRLRFTGRADHAGSTRMEDRADPMLTFASTALAADEQARLHGARATVGRVAAAPGVTNAIPGSVTAWLDARAGSADVLDALVGAVLAQAEGRAARDGTRVEVEAESVSGPVTFDAGLAGLLADGRPLLASQAGHDAGVLAAAGIPTAMLLVRNPSGVSHAPEESAEAEDCRHGVAALTETLRRLAGPGWQP